MVRLYAALCASPAYLHKYLSAFHDALLTLFGYYNVVVQLLFVYGTLKSSHDNRWARLLRGHSVLLGHGIVRGKLYRVIWYPGLVLRSCNSSIVHGEVYGVLNPEIIDALDRYEGQAFKRRRINVRLRSGVVRRAYVYLYTRCTAGLAPIESGEF